MALQSSRRDPPQTWDVDKAVSSARDIFRGAELAVLGLALLFLVSFLVAPSSVSLNALLSMAPFAAILGVASVGQQLVIQQRGLDLSVAGSISLVCVIATRGLLGSTSAWGVVASVATALLVASVAGLINGVLIVGLRIPALVMTIGANAILMGFVLWLSAGTPGNAPDLLDHFSLGRTLGVPNTVLVALLIGVVATIALNKTVLGRRFVLTGTNRLAARAAGIRIARYEIGAYAVAGFFYAIAGVLLAGLLKTPSLNAGQTYLLATVASVVVGGTSIAGGRASAVTTLLGAVFMTQLGQMLFSAGLDRSAQYLLQGAIVIAGASLHLLSARRART
jgi:ribose transport system permease protein